MHKYHFFKIYIVLNRWKLRRQKIVDGGHYFLSSRFSPILNSIFLKKNIFTFYKFKTIYDYFVFRKQTGRPFGSQALKAVVCNPIKQDGDKCLKLPYIVGRLGGINFHTFYRIMKLDC